MKAVAVVTVGGSARAADAFVVSRHKTMAAAKRAASALRAKLERIEHEAIAGAPHTPECGPDDVAAEWADDFVDAGGKIHGGYVRRESAYTPEDIAAKAVSS